MAKQEFEHRHSPTSLKAHETSRESVSYGTASILLNATGNDSWDCICLEMGKKIGLEFVAGV